MVNYDELPRCENRKENMRSGKIKINRNMGFQRATWSLARAILKERP
jgi:hypothetical protein